MKLNVTEIKNDFYRVESKHPSPLIPHPSSLIPHS